MKLYVVFDSGGQGMRDVGAMAIFDTKEKATAYVGEDWKSIKEVEINKVYPKGISYI